MPKRAVSTYAPSAPASLPESSYIHPVDLLEDRLRRVIEDTSNLVELTLDNYELKYETREDGNTWYVTHLREDGYCDPREKYYPRARRSLELALPAAVGISEWLRWGMGPRAGIFESELRSALTDMISRAHDFPCLPLYPVLKRCFERWKQNLNKVSDFHGELGNTAVESRDPAEWVRELRAALAEIRILFDGFVKFERSAQVETANLDRQHEQLIDAMKPVEDRLVRIGPRLVHAMKEKL